MVQISSTHLNLEQMSERDNNNNGKTEHKKMRYMFMIYREWVSKRKVGRATKRIFKQNLGERKKKASEFDMISANIKVLYCNRRANEIQLKLSAFQMFIWVVAFVCMCIPNSNSYDFILFKEWNVSHSVARCIQCSWLL